MRDRGARGRRRRLHSQTRGAPATGRAGEGAPRPTAAEGGVDSDRSRRKSSRGSGQSIDGLNHAGTSCVAACTAFRLAAYGDIGVKQWIQNRSLLAALLMGGLATIFLICVMAYSAT